MNNYKGLELVGQLIKSMPGERLLNQALWALHDGLWAVRGNDAGRVIVVDGSPYLSRLYVNRGRPDAGAFLHYFHKGDQGRDFHNHPWEWAYSFILTGGYSEERLDPKTGRTWRQEWKAGDVNYLTKDSFHRVDLHEGGTKGCWSLFVRGPRVQGWGFMNRETLSYVPMDADDSTED